MSEQEKMTLTLSKREAINLRNYIMHTAKIIGDNPPCGDEAVYKACEISRNISEWLFGLDVERDQRVFPNMRWE